MRTLRLQYEQGLISYETARAQLEREVRKSYYQVLLLEERAALLRERYETADRRVTMTRESYQAGRAPELSLLQAQVARENLKPAIDQAENGLKTAMAQFAINLGLDYSTAFELIPVRGDPEYIPLEVTELITKATSNKPDILALKQNILVLESRRKAQALQNFTPSLDLSWGMNRAFAGDPWKDSWFSSADDWQKSGSLTLSLRFSLHNLFPFSSGSQGVKDLDDGIRSANIGLAQTIRLTELEIYNMVLSLERTRITAEAQSLTVAMAEQAYHLTEEAYRAGLQDLLEVRNSEEALNEAKVQMLEQTFNYRMGLIDLEYAIGIPYGTLSSGGNEE
jgi:outer membrane protein TolC